jgi:hypothetical protein
MGRMIAFTPQLGSHLCPPLALNPTDRGPTALVLR